MNNSLLSRKSALIALFAAAIIAATYMLSRGMPGRPMAVNRTHLLQQVMDHVQSGYIEPTGPDYLYGLAMQGVMRELGDAHAAYIPADRVEFIIRRNPAFMADPGMDIDQRDDAIVVVAPYPGSPAERAGIRTLDRIVDVGGRNTFDMSAEEVRQALRGSAGSEVTVAVERAGTRGQLRFTLERQSATTTETVRSSVMLTGDVGYVRLTNFTGETANALASAVDSLVSQKMASLVVDLRGNPGGEPQAGVSVADLFLPAGSRIASTKGRAATDTRGYVDSSASRWDDLELILLVDEGTASASEVTAGALQDLDRALVVGRQTFGRGSRQDMFTLSNGAAVMLTTARWFTPLGRQIDLEANVDRPRGPDNTPSANRRPEVRTSSGRRVLGGGGIRPDLVVARAAASRGAGPPPSAEYRTQDTRAMVERDPFLKVALSLANRAQGQSQLLSLAVALDSADAEPALR